MDIYLNALDCIAISGLGVCVWGRGVCLWAEFEMESLELAAPSDVYPTCKRQCHFTCGFDFRHSLRLPFVAAFTVLNGLNTWRFLMKISLH